MAFAGFKADLAYEKTAVNDLFSCSPLASDQHVQTCSLLGPPPIEPTLGACGVHDVHRTCCVVCV